MIENELILRNYIKEHLQKMNLDNLVLFDRFLSEPDPVMYHWFTGQGKNTHKTNFVKLLFIFIK